MAPVRALGAALAAGRAAADEVAGAAGALDADWVGLGDGAGAGACFAAAVTVGAVGGGVGSVGVFTVGAVTVGAVTVGAGGVGTGSVGVVTVGGGSGGGEGSVGVGTETVGTGSVGTGSVGTSIAHAAAADKAAASSPATPQSSRTQIQLLHRRTGFGLPRVFSPAAMMRQAMIRDQDPYTVLGVPREASEAEIKQAYRRLARRLHPDVADRSEGEAFYEVVAAYEVLSHPRRRVLYDRLGLGGRRRQAPRPAPAVPPLELLLEWYEAERGASKPVEFEESVACEGCKGHGFEKDLVPGVCVRCRGLGRLSTLTESETLRYLEVAACPACEGRGHEPVPQCGACSGTGGRLETRTIRVRTPPGVRDGDQLKVEGIDRRFLLRVGQRPRDSRAMLTFAGLALLGGVALLLFVLLH